MNKALRSRRLCNLLACVMAILCSLSSCTNSKITPKELFAERASGVVLIRNKCYFKVNIPETRPYYFSRIDKIRSNQYSITNLTEDAKDIEVEVFGTGFFVSQNGEILTSSNVAFGEGTISGINYALQEALDEVLSNLDSKLLDLEYTEDELRFILQQENLSKEDRKDREVELKDCLARQERYARELEQLRKNKDKYQIEFVSEVGIAYTGADENDVEFEPCSFVNINEDDNFELALLQLKSKQTPKGKYIFDLNDITYWSDIKVGEKAYMIAFNEGLDLARTGNGLAPQITSGEVSREPNPACVLYSTPTMPGSSGGPVMDETGRLLALNYGGIPDEKSFNYGIAMSAASSYYNSCKENGLTEFRTLQHHTRPQKKGNDAVIETEDANDLVYTYYHALEEDNIKRAVRAFSPYNVTRYHKLHNTNRHSIGKEIAHYLKTYKVIEMEVKEFQRSNNDTFHYKLALQLLHRSNGTTLHYEISGRITCTQEEGSVFITEVEDFENKLLRQESPTEPAPSTIIPETE